MARASYCRWGTVPFRNYEVFPGKSTVNLGLKRSRVALACSLFHHSPPKAAVVRDSSFCTLQGHDSARRS